MELPRYSRSWTPNILPPFNFSLAPLSYNPFVPLARPARLDETFEMDGWYIFAIFHLSNCGLLFSLSWPAEEGNSSHELDDRTSEGFRKA